MVTLVVVLVGKLVVLQDLLQRRLEIKDQLVLSALKELLDQLDL
jgi:hypothetical protein